MAINLHNIDLASLYMTAGRDYDSCSGYEYLISAYEMEPSNIGRDGVAIPVTIHRASGFRSNAAAKRAGWNWARANLPIGAA